MKLLFVSDSFKGSLTSIQTVHLLTKAACEVFDQPDCSGVAVADGGEGTTDAVISATGGKKVYVKVKGPLFEEETVYYGKLPGNRAVLEMAAASGLPLLPKSKRNPLNTTSYGTGQMIKDALDHGFTDISIAIGGSATNDGGIGAMIALGARFLDEQGNALKGIGRDLVHISAIDLSNLDTRLKKTKITIMSDVTNPLCGPNGATYTFGGQKGGTPEILSVLEQGMQNYRNIIRKEFGIDPDELEGGGAAGGLGTALRVFLNGEMKSGIDTVLDLIGFDERLKGVDFVVTGEGRTDWQSCFGKVLQGIGERCLKYGIPVVALSGSLGKGAEQVFEHGVCSIMTTVNAPMSLQEAMNNAEQLYYSSAVRMFRFIRTGMILGEQSREKEPSIP